MSLDPAEIERVRESERPAQVYLNEQYQIFDQVLVIGRGLGPAFIHGRTGTLYYLNANGRFQNRYGHVYGWFWEQENRLR